MIPHRSLIVHSVRTIKESAVNSHRMVIACLFILLRVGWVVASFGCYVVLESFAGFSVTCPCCVAGVAVALYDDTVEDNDDGGTYAGDCAYLCIYPGAAV